MQLFRQKNLFLSSLLLLLLSACEPLRGYLFVGKSQISEQNVSPIIPKTNSLRFKTKIDLYATHFSGILIVKQTDSLTQRMTFVNEIGMKLFDFEVQKNELKPVYIFDAINKKSLVTMLSNDLQLVFLINLFNHEAKVYEKEKRHIFKNNNPKTSYYFSNEANTIESISIRGAFRTKIKTTFTYSASQNLEEIYLRHNGFFPLKMRLSLLPQQ